jgi:hypothetical protein
LNKGNKTQSNANEIKKNPKDIFFLPLLCFLPYLYSINTKLRVIMESDKPRKEIQWVRIYAASDLQKLEKALQILPRYNAWGEDRQDKNGFPISIVAYHHKAHNNAIFMDKLLGCWFKTSELYEKGLEIIRSTKHEAAEI